MKHFYKIVSCTFVCLSFVGHLLGSEMDTIAALAGVTYAILSLKENA
jgi:hypothetical protein